MNTLNQIKLFISGTSEIKEEFNSIRMIVDEVNKTMGELEHFTIQTLHWKTDTFSEQGEDPQAVINGQIGTDYDLLIAVIWQRLGTPTKREVSGTVEEINYAIDNKKSFLVYFKNAPPDNLNDINTNQLEKVRSFKQTLGQKGVLYAEFNGIKEFETLLRINLAQIIRKRVLAKVENLHLPAPQKQLKANYESVTELLAKADHRHEFIGENLDIFQLVEEMMSNLKIVSSVTIAMAQIYNELTEILNQRTEEFTNLAAAPDKHLAVKSSIIFYVLADNLANFSARLNKESDLFYEPFLSLGPAYAKINLLTINIENTEVTFMRDSMKAFRLSVERALNSSASILQTIMRIPPATTRFNNSKRTYEITIKEITRKLLTGLKSLDAAMELN